MTTGSADNVIPSAGSVAARQRAGNPRANYEQPAPGKQGGWPRPILDSGTPRRTMVLRHPKPAYISLTARRAQPAGPPPTQPTTHNTPPQTTNANARNQRSHLDKARSISVSGSPRAWQISAIAVMSAQVP